MIHAVVLPGLDGDASLRAEFAAALAPEFDVDVVSYPNDVVLDYEELTAFALERMPHDRPFVLIGESFSGPIAINLAAMRPTGLLGLVLCATFAKSPRPSLAPFRSLAGALPLRMLPMPLVMMVMMGHWSTREWRCRLHTALMALDHVVLYRRLVEAATIDVTARIADIDCPVLYIQATRDRVVFPKSWIVIQKACRDTHCVKIEAPHMLLQARPLECAEAIKRELSTEVRRLG